VGCGDGARTLANLPAGSLGLDISGVALSLATEEVPDARLLRGDLGTLPIREGAMDAITAYHAVFHVPRTEHPTVFDEFARLLRPTGWLLMTLPSRPVETVRRGWMGGRMRFSSLGRTATLDALAEAGFRVAETPTVTDPLGSTTEMVLATTGPQ
jgi:Methylase involved in ubiquinone/menaquinone biosynthesis